AAGWGGHKAGEARVFELEAGAAAGCLDVVGAADGGEGVEVEAVGGLLGHDVDPAISHDQRAVGQVEIQIGGEAGDVFGDPTFQFHEGRGPLVEAAHGGVGGEAAGVVFGG